MAKRKPAKIADNDGLGFENKTGPEVADSSTEVTPESVESVAPMNDDMLRPVCPVHYCSMKARTTDGGETRRYYCPVKGCKQSRQTLRDSPAEAIPKKPHMCRCKKPAVVDIHRSTGARIVLVCGAIDYEQMKKSVRSEEMSVCGYEVSIPIPRRIRIKRPRKSIENV